MCTRQVSIVSYGTARCCDNRTLSVLQDPPRLDIIGFMILGLRVFGLHPNLKMTLYHQACTFIRKHSDNVTLATTQWSHQSHPCAVTQRSCQSCPLATTQQSRQSRATAQLDHLPWLELQVTCTTPAQAAARLHILFWTRQLLLLLTAVLSVLVDLRKKLRWYSSAGS